MSWRRNGDTMDAAHERLMRDNAELRARLNSLTDELAAAKAPRQGEGDAEGGIMDRFRATLRASGDMMAFVDQDYVFRAVNDVYLKAYGRSRDEIVGRTIGELLGEAAFDDVVKACLDRCLRGEEVHDEAWFRHPAFGRTYRAVTYRPVLEEDGSVGGCIVTSRDITERKLALDALTESERRYRMLFERGAEGVMLMDREMRIHEANPRALELLAFSFSDLVGRRYHDLLHPEDIRAVPVRLDAVLSGETVRIERRLKRGTGDYMPADVSATLIGESIVQLMFVDMSERKRMEDALVRARAAAEEASRVKSDFLARISHEVRTPIAGILAMTEMAGKTTDATERARYFEMLRQSGRVLLELVDDILDLSKIEAGRLELAPRVFEVRDAILEQTAPFQHLALEKGLSLAVEIGCDVPEWGRADPARLGQIVRNLLSNAIKFTEHGGVTVSVDARPASEGRGPFEPIGHCGHILHVTVRDTGIGIPDDKQHLLYKSFSQLAPALSSVRGGTGLGLAISKQLAEKMGGNLWLESRRGEGSAFHFTILLCPAARPEDAAASAAAPVRLGDLQPLRMLLVEDNELVRIYMEDMLTEAGHCCVLATDGDRMAEACASCGLPPKDGSGSLFDVVLMDVNMPGMDGLAATRLIREAGIPGLSRDIPVIAFTAYAMQGDRDRFLAAGMNAHLPKPVSSGDLARVLAEVIGCGTGISS